MGNLQPCNLTASDLLGLNAGVWSWASRLRLGAGEFGFRGHEYQIEPLSSSHRRVVYMKATQGGFSEVENLRTLHGLIHGNYPQGVLYLFPTADDMRDYAKSRFDPLITGNRESIGQYVATGAKGVDKDTMKKVGRAFLYMRGATLSSGGGVETDEKDSGRLRSLPVDRIQLDEFGLMSSGVIAKAVSRMKHSFVKEECYISNPWIPGDSHDLLWQQSDQRYWERRCVCGRWFCADDEFPECVHVRVDGTGYIGCRKCGREVRFYNGRGTGRYVSRNRDTVGGMVGYHWSHLTSQYIDPADVLREFVNPPQHNLGDVYRLQLGKPYAARTDALTRGAVYDLCGQDVMSSQHVGPCAMGVDVGNVKHVVVGIRVGREKYEVVWFGKCKDFAEIHRLAKRFGVRFAVIDAMPDTDAARDFQRDAKYPVFLAQYVETSVEPVTFRESSGIVKVNRTEELDATHRLFEEKSITIPRRTPDVDEFAAQLCGTAKALHTNRRNNTEVYRYHKVGTVGDHFRHALGYFHLAAQHIQVFRAVGSRDKNRVSRALTEYDLIGV